MIRELWRYKKVFSFAYPISGANTSAAPVQVPVELTKYIQEDFVGRLLVRVSGNVIVAGTGPGTPTVNANPEGLLVSVNHATTPQLNALNPISNVSARGILVDNAFMRGYFVRGTAIPDTAGTQPVDHIYELYFKRPNVRKGVEWSHSIAKYSSSLLTMLFGSREQLFTGGTNTWDVSGLTVSIYADSDFAVDANRIHNHEFFERTYPILAAQTDFPIDTLPQGFLYTDLYFITEAAAGASTGEWGNATGGPTNGLLNNINLEGGGRVWLPQGEQNARVIRTAAAEYRGLITAPDQPTTVGAGYNSTGIYPVTLRDGMFTRAIDSLSSPITIKLDVNLLTGGIVRLVGRRMVPGQERTSNPGAAGAKPVRS